MAKWLKVAGLAVVALLVAASASGDSNTYNYQTRGSVNFNPKSGQVVDNTGAAIVNLNNAPQDYELISAGFMSTRYVYGADGLSTGWTSPVCVTVDSSASADVGGFSRLALLIYPQFEDSVAAAMFAIQVNIGSTSGVDTISKFAVLQHTVLASGAPDTLGSFTELIANKVQIGSSGADTSRAMPGETILLLGPSKNTHNGVCVMLTNRDGSYISGPQLKVRIRIMNTYGANFTSWTHTNGTASGVAIYGQSQKRTNLTAAGQSGGDTRFVILRTDLIGWR